MVAAPSAAGEKKQAPQASRQLGRGCCLTRSCAPLAFLSPCSDCRRPVSAAPLRPPARSVLLLCRLRCAAAAACWTARRTVHTARGEAAQHEGTRSLQDFKMPASACYHFPSRIAAPRCWVTTRAPCGWWTCAPRPAAPLAAAAAAAAWARGTWCMPKKSILSASSRGRSRWVGWGIETGCAKHQPHHGMRQSPSPRPPLFQVVATASTDTTIKLWDLRTLSSGGANLKPLATGGHPQACQAAMFAPDGGWHGCCWGLLLAVRGKGQASLHQCAGHL